MKTYTATFELTSPKTQKIYVPRWSSYKIGIAVTKDGQDAEGTLVVKLGDTALQADEAKTGMWTTYAQTSQEPDYGEYTVEWTGDNASAKFKLIRVVTGSSTFESGESGGGVDPGELTAYAEKTWVNEQLEDYALTSSIPVVNNATVTVQQDGTTVGTFTLNQANNATVNIPAPASISASDIYTDSITVGEESMDPDTGEQMFTGYAQVNGVLMVGDDIQTKTLNVQESIGAGSASIT